MLSIGSLTRKLQQQLNIATKAAAGRNITTKHPSVRSLLPSFQCEDEDSFRMTTITTATETNVPLLRETSLFGSKPNGISPQLQTQWFRSSRSWMGSFETKPASPRLFSSSLSSSVLSSSSWSSSSSSSSSFPTTESSMTTTTTIRLFGSPSRRGIEARNAKRLKIKQANLKKRQKRSQGPATATQTDNDDDDDDEDNSKEDEDSSSTTSNVAQQPFLQHQEWVKFQQSIAVEGFYTGQVTKASVYQTKTRGGKRALRKRERELQEALEAQGKRDMRTAIRRGATAFDAKRLSKEETNRLLELAYSKIPERTGKRGTRNLQRQSRRWFLVRKIHAKEKYYRGIVQHERRMQRRHDKRQDVIEIKETVPFVRQTDLEYQAQLLRQWAKQMHGHDDVSTVDVATAEELTTTTNEDEKQSVVMQN